MKQTGFYATRLRVILSIYIIQKEILSINKELLNLPDGSLKLYLQQTKLVQMRHYLEKVCEVVREKHN